MDLREKEINRTIPIQKQCEMFYSFLFHSLITVAQLPAGRILSELPNATDTIRGHCSDIFFTRSSRTNDTVLRMHVVQHEPDHVRADGRFTRLPVGLPPAFIGPGDMLRCLLIGVLSPTFAQDLFETGRSWKQLVKRGDNAASPVDGLPDIFENHIVVDDNFPHALQCVFQHR